MKTVLLFLALAVACCAQTLKWERPLAAANIQATGPVFYHLRGDASGTVAATFNYYNPGVVAGCRIWWLTNTGKTLVDDLIEGSALCAPMVMAVSPTCLVIRFVDADGNVTIRKYARRGAAVQHVDTPLSKNDQIALDPLTLVPTDAFGFFIVAKDDNGAAISLKRFSVR